MSRWERPLLLFSLALNAAFISLAAMQHVAHPERPAQFARESPDDHRSPRHRRAQRRAIMGRELGMDRDQMRHLDQGFDAFRPELGVAREQVAQQRLAYKEALMRGDGGAARTAVADLSRAQTRLDSLCAEAMLRETAELRPEQRAHYVRWTFRHRAPGRFTERNWK